MDLRKIGTGLGHLCLTPPLDCRINQSVTFEVVSSVVLIAIGSLKVGGNLANNKV